TTHFSATKTSLRVLYVVKKRTRTVRLATNVGIALEKACSTSTLRPSVENCLVGDCRIVSLTPQGLGSLLSPEASRPMAVLDDNIARIVPGVSGVPEELRNLGVGPTLYSVLQRSPGLSEALLEMAGKVGLSSLLGK
ncbi:unnamed protein product, partial [Ectocarpus sp. 4 AP-2014]